MIESGFNITNAVSIEITILATELAVLALFPAIYQMIGEIRDSSVYAGYNAKRRFNAVIYVNLFAIAVTVVSTVIGCLALLGWVTFCDGKGVLYSFVITAAAFSALAAVLAIVVSVQIVRR